MEDPNKQLQIRLIRGVLLLGTFFLYFPVVLHPFITFDDFVYVGANWHVAGGVSWSGLRWALSSGFTGNWHPVTWISHMIDCQLYGLKHPGGHHLTNLLFHTANSLLLFEVWRRLTGAAWRSALVAALFAWHPLHVESVAWVAERKDLLSAFFFLLTLLSYTCFVETSRIDNPKTRRWYWAAFALFALGLMSKPMVVTLPFVLLLLDFWPLRRISIWKLQTGPEPRPAGQLTPVKLLLEKVPFFLLAALSSIITFMLQKGEGAMRGAISLTLADRLGIAILGYAAYLKKTFWPVDLAVFYPFPKALPHGGILAAGLLLVLICLGVTLFARSRPWWFAGWFWFMGMLVPVIGLVQVGVQAYADRYTYLPLIGIFIAMVWGVGELTAVWPNLKNTTAIASVAVLLACVVLTRRQIGFWENSTTLFEHARQVTGDNPVVENNLGLESDAAGKYDEAIEHYKNSLRLAPGSGGTWQLLGITLAAKSNYEASVESYQRVLKLDGESDMLCYNYGNALAGAGDLLNAAAQFKESIRLEPAFPQAHNNLGAVLMRMGRLDEALAEFKTALRLQPRYPEAQDQMGRVLLKLGHPDLALHHFTETVALAPSFADAHLQIGLILAHQGKLQEALIPLKTAVQLETNNAEAVFNLAALYDALHQYDLAADDFAQALRLTPRDADAATRLGAVLAKQGKFSAAITAYRQALEINPDGIVALQGLAWILATSPESSLRNGAEALRLAQHAAELTGRKQPVLLTVLDVALAETGQFDEAIKTAQEGAQLAKSLNQNEIASQALARIELYKAGKPFRQ